MSDNASAAEGPIDSVLLIDGDNDPHLPTDFNITDRTLARVFVRMGAKMPRGLEKRLGSLANCVAVISPKSGSNAADFVMAMHAGILHATLPMHLPFTIVTNDKSLSVTAQELQRVGRQTTLWTSHPEKSVRRRGPAKPEELSSQPAAEKKENAPSRARRSRRGGSRRGRGSGRAATATSAVTPAPILAAVAVPGAILPAPIVVEVALNQKLAQVVAAYAQRLSRIKDPPSRLKTLINDIASRTKSAGFDPLVVIEELKRRGALTIDDKGRVHHQRPPAL